MTLIPGLTSQHVGGGFLSGVGPRLLNWLEQTEIENTTFDKTANQTETFS